MSEPTDVFPCGGCGQPIRANDGHRYDDCVARRRRCAEALAGMNPAKLAALIEACEDVSDAHSGACNHWKVKRALAELRGEEAHRG